jgi:RNA polymerase sigma factor (TIGR02999 family)
MSHPHDHRDLGSLAADRGVSQEVLLPELYQSLRRMAHRQLQAERTGHSLNTTALVHEAWMQLASSYPDLQFSDDRQFLALSGQLMRRVLVAHARKRRRLKRGAGQIQITLTDAVQALAAGVDGDELLALDQALAQLQALDARQVEIVELRYFAGFSIEESAQLLSLSPATVKREWAMARAWLLGCLEQSLAAEPGPKASQ